MSPQNSPPTLGVVAISRNEERDMPGFLEHLMPWVDEIVIVDDGSTDKTQGIAQSAGEKVHFIQSPRAEGEYYADQRNRGVEKANSDWLLHMDIDERVPPELALEILAAIRNPNYDAYRYPRVNYFLQRPMRGGGLTDWNLVHLARRQVLRFSGMYHEKIKLTVSEERVGQLRQAMHHLNDVSYSERLGKSSKYQLEVAEHLKNTNMSLGYIDILLAFIIEFFYKYFWKKGYLDGVPGLIWAFHGAFSKFCSYALVWDEQNRLPREDLEEDISLMWKQYSLKKVLNKTDLQ